MEPMHFRILVGNNIGQHLLSIIAVKTLVEFGLC